MKERAFYRCAICGNIVGIIKDGGGELICCGQPMGQLIPNTVDAAAEKHVPVAKKPGEGLTVEVGGIPHPMTEEHHIEWICVEEPGRTQRAMLAPGDAPKAEYNLHGDQYEVFAYCNLHGLWKG